MKKLMSVLIFTLLLFVSSGLGNKVFANESPDESKVIDAANELAETYGLTSVTDENITPESTLKFDSIEAFEAFLKAEELNSNNSGLIEVTQPDNEISTFAAGGTKTYTFKEYTGVSVITSSARVTRNSSGIVTKVIVWSDQSGVNVPIKYVQNTSWYTLNASKKGGKATVKGTKFYGVNVVGQELGYSKSVTYTVPF